MDLKRFDTKEKLSIDPSSTILIYGGRRSGKTTYAKYLVRKIKSLYGLIIVFTHTKFTKQWDSIVDPEYIFEDYNPDVIKSLFKRSKILKKKRPEANRNVLVILDDIIDDPTIHSDEMINALFIRGRWSNLGVLFLTQYINSVSPIVRENSDIIIVPQQNSRRSIELLYENYGIIDKKDFYNLISKYTENYMVLVIRNDKKTNDIHLKYQFDRASNK